MIVINLDVMMAKRKKGLTELAGEVEKRKATMTDSASALLETLNLYTECEQIFTLVANYAQRASDVDTKNTENQANVQKMMGIMVGINSRTAFVEPEILEIPEEKLEKYIMKLFDSDYVYAKIKKQIKQIKNSK